MMRYGVARVFFSVTKWFFGDVELCWNRKAGFAKKMRKHPKARHWWGRGASSGSRYSAGILLRLWPSPVMPCIELLSGTVYPISLVLPSQNCTTAYFPLQAQLLAPTSPLSSLSRNRSSSPSRRPTTVSDLHVRSAKVRIPDPFPKGPIAAEKGVVMGHFAYSRISQR